MTAKHSGVAKLWLLNLFGNAALVAAFYFWLLLPDAHGWQVAGSGLLGLIVIFFGAWLRGGSFAYFRLAEFREHAAVWPAFRQALHHLIALVIWVIPLAAAEWWLLWLRRFAPQFGVWWWQKAPLLRFGSPRAVSHVADVVLFILMALLAAVWLPAATTVAASGFKGNVARSWRVLKLLKYWLWFVALVILGVYLPYRIVWWIPEAGTLNKQAWSAGVRFFFGYLLLISAWVSLLLVTGEFVEAEDGVPDSTKP
jgi:hypothetical protein